MMHHISSHDGTSNQTHLNDSKCQHLLLYTFWLAYNFAIVIISLKSTSGKNACTFSKAGLIS
jgi:hypothetical protein